MTSGIELKKIVVQAIAFVVDYRKSLLKALAVPVSIGIILDVLDTLVTQSPGVQWSIMILEIPVYTAIAVVTHRIVLLGPQSISEWGLSKWSLRETQFTLYSGAIGIIFFLIMIGPIVIFWLMFKQIKFWGVNLLTFGGLTFAFAIVGALWSVGRLSLVFPGLAIDRKLSFGQSWTLTKHNQLTAIGILIMPFLFGILFMLIGQIPYTSLLIIVMSYLATVLGIAALSLFYKEVSLQEDMQNSII
jgi:hypothetical protein